MGVKIENAIPQCFAGSSTCQNLSLTIAFFIIILALSAGQAWSLDRLDPGGAIEGAEAHLSIRENNASPPSAMSDKCLPLLQSIRQTTSVSAMDRNQRTAGKAAALGLVLGVRFALSPNPKGRPAKSRVGFWQPQNGFAGDRRALAIAEYRSCQKDQALKSSMDALEEFRWSR